MWRHQTLVLAIVSLVLGYTLSPVISFGQQFQSLDIEGQVLLPTGGPLVAGVVYAMPNDPKHSIKSGATKTSTTTGQDGRYRLNIMTDGPIQLRFGGANNYKSLSHLSGVQNIHCIMAASSAQQKQQVIGTIMDASEWGERWNEYIPESAKEAGDAVLFQDGKIIIPKKYSELFSDELKADRRQRRFGRLDDGALFLHVPQSGGERRIGVSHTLRDVGNGKLERFPVLDVDR